MKGIEAAVTGRLGRDLERWTTKAGKAMVMIAVAVDCDGEETQWTPRKKPLDRKPLP
jgi:hypothetical protein